MKALLGRVSLIVLACFGTILGIEQRALGLSEGDAAVKPADRDLIAEARRVLDYLQSVRGKNMLSGISGSQDAQPWAVLHTTGREPAIRGGDMAGYHRKWEKMYQQVMQHTVDRAIRWWREKGGIVALQYHWMKPGDPEGSAWVAPPRGTGPLDLAKAVTPGTEENEAVMADLKITADYLEQLAQARVPVLWRPLHEIDGGWFWWTDPSQPENTAALWRLMFDYFVKQRKLHNLIWVYNAAHISLTREPPAATIDDEVAHRKRYYPGAEYVDIASIDTYANPKLGWGQAQKDARLLAYELMQMIAPGKMLAIAEDAALVNPDVPQGERPAWLYCSAWWAGGKNNPVAWMRTTFNHQHYLTLDELPLLAQGNVMPNVGIAKPFDGAALKGSTIAVSGIVTDRNKNLRSVSLYAIEGPWRNWFVRDETEVLKAFREAACLGEARVQPDGSWSFTWNDPAAGFYSLAALAEDSDGLVACSNVVRVSVGLENLARNAKATASSTSQWGDPAEPARDGDLNSMWWSDKDQPDPQWLMLDLGTARRIGAVSVLWWKASAADYTVEVSADAQSWTEVGRTADRNNYPGDIDLIRFDPVEARHVRLHCTRPAVTWQAYTVYELGVWEPTSGILASPSAHAAGRGPAAARP
jgi:mannan endo-1,4-beta-mannosidase